MRPFGEDRASNPDNEQSGNATNVSHDDFRHPRALIAEGPSWHKTFTFQAQDGSQVCVTLWTDGGVEVLVRTDGRSMWSPPLDCIREES